MLGTGLRFQTKSSLDYSSLPAAIKMPQCCDRINSS
jgi:hypothetical protein